MQKKDLAAALRDRQRRYGFLPEELITSASDDMVIASYATCSECGIKWVKDLPALIADAESVEDFLARLPLHTTC